MRFSSYRRLVEHFAKEFTMKNDGSEITRNKRALRRLRTAAEKAKRTLSSSTQASVEVDALFQGIVFLSTL